MTSASPSETLRAYLCDAAKVGVCSDLNLPWAAVWEQTAKLNCNSAHSCRWCTEYVPGLSELHIQRLLQSEITETNTNCYCPLPIMCVCIPLIRWLMITSLFTQVHNHIDNIAYIGRLWSYRASCNKWIYQSSTSCLVQPCNYEMNFISMQPRHEFDEQVGHLIVMW